MPESYGECPHLTLETALALNKGLIGFAAHDASEPPRVAKVLPVLRHFGAYAGPDAGRFHFDAQVRRAARARGRAGRGVGAIVAVWAPEPCPPEPKLVGI